MEKEDMPGDPGLVAELAVFATLPVAEMLFLDSLPNISQQLYPDSKEGQHTPGWYKKKHSQEIKRFFY